MFMGSRIMDQMDFRKDEILEHHKRDRFLNTDPNKMWLTRSVRCAARMSHFFNQLNTCQHYSFQVPPQSYLLTDAQYALMSPIWYQAQQALPEILARIQLKPCNNQIWKWKRQGSSLSNTAPILIDAKIPDSYNHAATHGQTKLNVKESVINRS